MRRARPLRPAPAPRTLSARDRGVPRAPPRPRRTERARRRGAGSPERALQSREEALVAALARVVLGPLRRLQALQQPALLVVEPLRDEHAHEQPLVAAPEALQLRHPFPAQHDHLPRLRAGVEVELLLAFERRHGDARAERRLRDGQLERGVDVVPLADEARVGLDADEDVDVAGDSARGSRVALAAEADPLPVVDSRRNLDAHRALAQGTARALAARAELLDDLAAPAAARARDRAHELAEEARGHLLELAAPVAGGAGREPPTPPAPPPPAPPP